MMRLIKHLEASSNSILGPNLYILNKIGIWRNKNNSKNFLFFILIFNCIYFVPSEFIELWLLRSRTSEALKNISYTFLSIMIYAKSISMIVWQESWEKIVTYIWDFEKRVDIEKDRDIKEVVLKDRGRMRLTNYYYWNLAFIAAYSLTLAPILGVFLFPENRARVLNGTDPYPEIMSSWMPFDKTRGWGYVVTYIIQAENYFIGPSIIVSFDGLVFTAMTVFSLQLKVLRIKCEKLFDKQDTDQNRGDMNKKIRDCFLQHENLLRTCDLLNSLLSPLLFFYITFSSILLCACTIILTTSNMATIWLSVYLAGLISQLFFYCWHSNEVRCSSLELSYRVFASAWWSADSKTQRNILLLNGKMKKTILFTAGPFTTLNIGTFVHIIKSSYSVYTLLRNSH